jgi:hypothetical protein
MQFLKALRDRIRNGEITATVLEFRYLPPKRDRAS